MYEVSLEVAVASLSLSLKNPGDAPGVWVVFCFSWGMAGAEAVFVAVEQVMVMGSNVSFSLFQSRCNQKVSVMCS